MAISLFYLPLSELRYSLVLAMPRRSEGKGFKMEKIYAFVDESGNHDLDTSKLGSSNFFVVCSVIVAEKELEECYAGAEAIRVQHFQKGEIKSSNIKIKDSIRRLRILDQFCQLPLKLYITVVDKSRLYQDGGFQHKKSFIKYMNGLLYQRLFLNFAHLQVLADEHGSAEFQESLKSYLMSRYANDLFGQSVFETKCSKDDVMIQVADFFAGTIAQIYEGKATADIVAKYKNMLSSLSLGILEWPPQYQSLLPPSLSAVDYADYEVHRHALNQADNFIAKVGHAMDEDERLQLCILNFLRFKSEFLGNKDYISTSEIEVHLRANGFGDLTEQKIRSSGVAKLRDRDVIIASGAKGYKIPQTRADITDFLSRASSQIVPLLDRIKKARDVYMLASRGEYDILKTADLSDLQRLLDSLDPIKSSK